MSFQAVTWAIAQRAGGPSGKAVLWSIANYANDMGCAWPSQQTIVEESEQSADSVQRRIPDLVDRGLVRRIPLRFQGRKTVDFFILATSPHFAASLAEIEPLLPRGCIVEPRYAAADCGNVAAPLEPPDVAADCGNALPQTLPQSAADATAYVRQQEPVMEPRNQERESVRASEGQKQSGGLTVAEALAILVKLWPDYSLDSETRAVNALSLLSASERQQFVAAVPVFLAMHREKRKGKDLPYLHNLIAEKGRWLHLLAPPAKASAAADRKHVGAFDRAWFWLYFDTLRRLGVALLDPRSAASIELRSHVDLARSGIGWPVGVGRFEEIEAAGKRFVQIAVDGPEFKAWAAALRAVGVDLPRPDKAPRVFVPTEWPPDERERDAALRDEGAEIMGVGR
jgi:hypothetical protein